MKKIIMNKYVALFFILLMVVAGIYFYVDNSRPVEIEEGRINYFYSRDCTYCNRITPFLEELELKYNVKINYYEISSNSNLFKKFLDKHELSRWGVPIVFIDDQYFMGALDIEQYLELAIQGIEFDLDDKAERGIQSTIIGLWDVNISLENRSLLFITFIIAFLDSLNVCSITVVIFLIVYSLSIGSLKRAFKIGIIFTLVIFLFYASFMIFLTGVINFLILRFGIFVRTIIIFISVVAGLLLIKDFFWYGRGITLRIPQSAKPLLEKYMKNATLGSAVLLGLLASIVELPCTAVFPLLYTAILAENSIFGLTRILYILLYNLIYVLPLLIIVFGTYFSWLEISDVDQKIQKYKKHLKLIAGVALLMLALYFAYPLLG